MSKLDRGDMARHAQDWIDAWNRHDIEAVLAVYSEDAVFISPRAADIAGRPVLQGKEALRRYWETALAAVPDLRFELDSLCCDEAAQCLMVSYIAFAGGRQVRACELMRFRDRRQVQGEAFYGAPMAEPADA